MRYVGVLIVLCGLAFNSYAYPPAKAIAYRPHRLMRFVQNKTQWDARVAFKTDLPNGCAYIEKDAFTYVLLNPLELEGMHPQTSAIKTLHGQVVRERFLNAHTQSIEGQDTYPDYANYFKGNDPAHWSTHAAIHKQVYYTGLYNHIDMRVYSAYDHILTYDLIIHAGGNANDIAIAYEGADKVTLTKGNLLMYTTAGTYTELKPYAYQVINSKKITIPCKFNLSNESANGQPTLTYRLGKYDTRFDVVIDPSLVFSTYTGATIDNWGYTATYDNHGNMFLGGLVSDLTSNSTTSTTGYPTTAGAFQITFGGGNYAQGIQYPCDIGITKFDSTGSKLIYSTYLGGANNETPHSLICDANGNLYIYGVSYSTDFPTTPGCYSSTGDVNGNLVVVEMNSTGTALLGSTYIGGTGSDGVNYDPTEFISGDLKVNYGDQNRGEINIDKKGNIVVATCSKSTDFPTTAGVFQPISGGGLQDGVVFKFNSALTSLMWSSYIGGASDDAAYSVELADDNTLYVVGGTMSTNFPTTPNALNPTFQGGASDGFITHISEDGSTLLQSSFIGTAGADQIYFVQIDKHNNVYFVGQTNGVYPTTPGVYSNPNSGQFISKINPSLDTIIWSTVVGNGNGTANISPTAFLVDTCENIYLCGWGTSGAIFSLENAAYTHDMHNMPLTADAYQSTTDGTDFYIMILKRDATALLYGTYFGGNGAIEHVDGGTSRFDKNGYMYEAICAGCLHGEIFGTDTVTDNTPTTATAWSATDNSFNCNELGFKFKLDVTKIKAAVNATPKATGCAPLHVQFINNSTNAYDYVWIFGDGTPDSVTFQPSHIYTAVGTYTVKLVAYDPSGCSLPDTAYTTVTVKNNSANAQFTLTQQNSCDSLIITGLAGVNSKYAKYKWTINNKPFSTNNSIYDIFTTSVTDTIRLSVIDTSACNPFDTVTKIIVFNAAIHAHVSDTAIKGCVPLKAFIKNTSSGGKKITWYSSNGIVISQQDSFQYIFTKPGTYKVKLVIYDSSACNKTDSAFVRVTAFGPAPVANFSMSTSLAQQAQKISFTNLSTGTVDAYNWDFGDGTTSSDINPVHSYNSDGTFNVCLTAAYEGCSSVICQSLVIKTDGSIGVPNAFSPNGDGKNDILYVRGQNYKDIDFKVYNRWGQLVFETNDYSIGWNGTMMNDGMHPQEMDVYVWTLSATDPQGNPVFKKGNVTLLR